tara:strand:+ start:335 stop:574 length:240 start_codon:yes stop_codon:yes gene_type:complete
MTAPEAISAALREAGIRFRSQQAAIIGESATMWSRYLNGHRSPQCGKVQIWLKNAHRNGHAIQLIWDHRIGVTFPIRSK